MKIWIDSDACPGEIKEIIIKAAHKRQISAIFVSNKIISIPESPFISSVQVPHGPDVADDYIAEKVTKNDLVITQDIPLAARTIESQAVAISVHGDLFTTANIRERLSVRNFLQELRDSGVQTSGPKAYSAKDKQKFANTFAQQLDRLSKL